MNGNRKIVLQDGRELYGKSFGAERDTVCELVFNTSMVGYRRSFPIRPIRISSL